VEILKKRYAIGQRKDFITKISRIFPNDFGKNKTKKAWDDGAIQVKQRRMASRK
jgi:hypothetical protein